MSLVNSNTYTGKYSSDFMASLIYNAGSFDKITIMPNVVGITKIPSALFTSTPLVADACAFSAAGDVTLNAKTITPVAVKMNVSVCKTDLDASFLTERMRAGAMNKEFPTDVNDFILSLAGQSIKAQIESLFWNGDTTSLFQGVWYKSSADTTTIKLSANTITSSNVIAELDRVYTNIPSAVLFNTVEKPKIYIAPAVAKYYRQALASLNRAYNPTTEYELMFQGLELAIAPFTSNNKMIAALPSNLVYGCDLVSDLDTISVIDMSDKDGSDEIRFKARIKNAADFKVGAELVVYGTTNGVGI